MAKRRKPIYRQGNSVIEAKGQDLPQNQILNGYIFESCRAVENPS